MTRIALVALAASGCVEEGVIVCVDSADPESFAKIELTLAVARSDPSLGPVCNPAVRDIDPAALEFCVAVAPGATYGAAVFLRAGGLDGSRTVIAKREVEVPFREGERYEAPRVLLDTSCFESQEEGPCNGPAEQCLEGACVEVPRQGVFDVPEGSSEADCVP